MAFASTTNMSSSVATAYEKDFIFYSTKSMVWANLFFEHMRKEVVGGRALRGKTVRVPIYTSMAEVTTSLTEGEDVTPVGYADSYVDVSIAEEGNVLQTTSLLENIAAYVDIGRPIARALGINLAQRRDKILRNAIVFNAAHTLYGGTATTRAGLDLTNDKITYDRIVQAIELARALDIPSLPDGTYFTVFHPLLMADLISLTQVTNIAYYQYASVVTRGDFSDIEGKRLPNEVLRLYDLRFVRSPLGKLFLGAGTPAQSATTVAENVDAGATSVVVTSASNIAAGDYVTIGPVESGTTVRHTTEQVLVTAVNSNTLTIKGAGKEGVPGNTGLKFGHSSGEAVTEAPNVAALPILGPESAIIAYANDPGWEGKVSVDFAPTNIPQRLINHSWYWVGGAKIVPNNVVQLEVAASGWVLGNN